MLKEKKTKIVQIRLSEDDYAELKVCAYMLGTTVSAYIRQMIRMSVNAAKMSQLFDTVKNNSEVLEVEMNED